MKLCTKCNSKSFNETLNRCMNPACGATSAPPAKATTVTASPPKPVVTDITRGGARLINPPKPDDLAKPPFQPKPSDIAPVFTVKKFTPPPTAKLPAVVSSVPTPTVGVTAVKKPSWKEKEAALAKEYEERAEEARRNEAEMVNEVMASYPTRVVLQPPKGDKRHFFRSTGAGQEPWDVLAAGGFQHRWWKTKNVTELKAKLKGIYGKTNKGAEAYMTGYRGNPDTNPAQAPFVSFGKSNDGGQGASKNDWHFYIEVTGLTVVPVTPHLLGVGPDDLHPLTDEAAVKVELLTDTGDLDNAAVVLLLHGPMPEATFLNCCPVGYVKAWKRLTGKPWQHHWRAFDAATVGGIQKIAKEYGIQIGVA